jgi:hypothetical protein
MLDRLSETMPKWSERNPSDIGVMLVELLAYRADYLSYYQDAVATEAYLGTARKRVSMRRHARMLDYLIHDGCNARAWVVIKTNQTDINGVKLLGPSIEKNRPGVRVLVSSSLEKGKLDIKRFQDELNFGAQVFETMHDVILFSSLDTINFYTWSDEQCCLPKGSTQATLDNHERALQKVLKRGSLLVFEEDLGPTSGLRIDADPSHRHVVRLIKVTATNDPLDGRAIIKIRWDEADALPFDLQISSVNNMGQPITNISVARGNVVLADAGYTLPEPEQLWNNSGWIQARPRPQLKEGPLTQQGRVYDQHNQWVLFDEDKPARLAMKWELRDARPAINVWEDLPPNSSTKGGPRWEAQRDLLISDRFARHFVVETEDDGRAYLRFGDNSLGKQPDKDTKLKASYRIGNGSSGNVGANTIKGILLLQDDLAEEQRQDFDKLYSISVYNPLPARGGIDPEPIEQIRQYAPQAFREQRRAVTTADYAEKAKQYPGVQNASADRRWTGSWHTIFITVDREGGKVIDDEFRHKLRAFLEEYRLSGHDLEIENPRFVALDITMKVKVKSGYFQSAVKKALIDSFGTRIGANKVKGFFHPDNFSFGQAVYLSKVLSTAIVVAGVESVYITRFKRWLESEAQGRRAIETGYIGFEHLEIARLDNDPSSPENGRIEFQMEGGL